MVIVFGLLVTLTVLVARGAAALVAVDDGARELSTDALSSASWLRTATDWLAGPGSSVLLGASMLALLVVLIRRRRFWEMLWVVVAVVAQFAAEMVLTDLVARLPPDPLADTGYSFPSGHTASATVVLMLLLGCARRGDGRGRGLWLVGRGRRPRGWRGGCRRRSRTGRRGVVCRRPSGS